MKYIFLHGLGQTSFSWNKTLEVMSDKWDILCPNLADWLYNERPCYETLYKALERCCNSMYEMIEELPDYIVECLDEFISHYGTLEEVVEHKDDIYYYPDCETMTDVAYYYIDELQALGDIPPSLQNYIDYEAYGRDLDMGGCFIETSRGMCEIPY